MINTSFTDNTENHVSNWAWDFGDGNISNEQNPNHTYTTIGKYTVSLTVIGNGGTDTETKTDYITTYDPTGITSNRTDKFFKLYPNPTKLSCTISLTLEEAKNVKITASNSKGQIVDVIYIGFLSDNSHEFEINISDFPAGLYFISLNTDSFNSIQKLIIIK